MTLPRILIYNVRLSHVLGFVVVVWVTTIGGALLISDLDADGISTLDELVQGLDPLEPDPTNPERIDGRTPTPTPTPTPVLSERNVLHGDPPPNVTQTRTPTHTAASTSPSLEKYGTGEQGAY